MTRLRVAIIGAGSIGRRHVEVVQAHPDTELSAIVDPDTALRARLDDLPFVASLDAAHADAAIIATPTPDHHATATACLERGWPVIVEKPLAATVEDAQALCDLAEAKGLPLITGHHRRCHPFTLAARAALTKIGDIAGVQGLWSLRKHDTYYDLPWRRRKGHGPILSNLSHEIDLMQFLVGPIREVAGFTSNARRGLEIEDGASLAFRFETGALGSILISDAGLSPWAFEAASGENPQIAASHADYLRFTGTKGALAFPSLTRWHGKDWRTPLTEVPGTGFARVDPLLEQVGRFAALVRGTADDVLCTGREGLSALRVTLAAAEAADIGRTVGIAP